MRHISTFLFFVGSKVSLPVVFFLLVGSSFPIVTNAQINVGLTAVASHTAGGVTIYGPANYNDNGIVAWPGACGSFCPTPWGWVSNGQTIIYTWTTAQTFNKIVFYKADRPMNACNIQYWNGSSFVPLMAYASVVCPVDSVTFTPITTTILQFVNCVAPAINPNFREIQVWQSGPPPPTIAGATRYCTGDIITLTASSTAPGPTFSWTGPSAFTATTAAITLVASPATAGVYSCTVTSAGYTSAPRLDTIVVVTPPTITVGATPAICQGTTFASLPYSATTSGPTNYSIVYSPAAITAGFVNLTSVPLPVSPITLAVPAGAAPGTYTGTITVNNGTCSGPGSAISIPINPNPAPITGAANICTGSTITLSDITPGGTWSSSNPAVATIGSSTGIVTGVIVGSAVMHYTITATGCSVSVPVNVVGITGPNHVCAGDSITLSATSVGGPWSSGDITLATVRPTAGVVTGVAMGIVPISYTLGSGCVARWTITVNPLAPIVGRDSVCQGSDRWLTNIVGGGIWSSTSTAVATVLPDSGKVTGILAGITTISYILPTGCKTATSFRVIAYPNAITGITKACPGTSTTLSNTVTGGKWTSGDNGVATVDINSGIVTGVFADTVDIIYTIEPGCPVYTRVTINPLPAPITGADIACPNTVDSLHDVTPGGLWTSGTLPIVTVVDTDGAVTAISQGVGIISYTLPTGCYRTKTVIVRPIPVPAIIYNFVTGTLVAPPGYVTYQWYDSIQGKIPGATSPSVAALNSEYYFVEVTDSNGCVGRSVYYHFNISQLGLNNPANQKINIYPNPASAILIVESFIKVHVVISGIDGRQVLASDAGPGTNELDISKLANGIYMVTLYDESGVRVSVKKLTKE